MSYTIEHEYDGDDDRGPSPKRGRSNVTNISLSRVSRPKSFSPASFDDWIEHPNIPGTPESKECIYETIKISRPSTPDTKDDQLDGYNFSKDQQDGARQEELAKLQDDEIVEILCNGRPPIVD
ncbi:unnamed protein product [Protopolystoma xenopodis]|uniref:Uncharacterized protein n=1 Tax=Protopolystoma xenopodis TaxID=117903 RepID=A0A3S5A7G0_9PLAT|nr:unnamed protein product [Protopolystoma xenopodis]